MKSLRLWPLLGALSLAACKKSEPNSSVATGNSPITAPLDYVAAQGKAKKFAEKTINMVELQSAIQKFQAMEDRYPRDFNELVSQHYLREAPVPPPGMKFVFNSKTGQVALLPEDQVTAPVAPATAAPVQQPRRGPGGIRIPQQGASPVGE
jgi:hypothetical protein